MKIEKTKITLFISAKQKEMLRRLSEIRMKPQTVLIREAIDTLFKTPGGK